MRVITTSQYGPPEVLHAEERAVPSPRPNEVVVEVKAAGINLMDTYVRRGLHGLATTPLALGVEGAGVVTAVGGQAMARVGDRVAWEHVPGSYADLVAVPADRLVPIPDGVSFETAAAGLMQGLTSHYLSDAAVSVPRDGLVPAAS